MSINGKLMLRALSQIQPQICACHDFTKPLLHPCSSQLSAQTIQGLDALDGPSFLDEGFTLPELEALMQDPVGEAPACRHGVMQQGTPHLANTSSVEQAAPADPLS